MRFFLSVADNGRGIPEEKLRRILSELDTGSHENGRIGLYNVHQRARIKYGPGYGIVAIESRPGRTVVRLRLKGERKDAEGHPD